MTNAVKHLDLVFGVDVHLVLAPPVAQPTPLPSPYVGMVFDPFDYLPFIGSTVSVNGLPRAQAGTAGTALPPHLPVPGPFAPALPTNESEMFMGSSTVSVDGDAQTFNGLPVLSCQAVGMPAPFRKKGQPPKSLVLPTSTVLAIPAGPPVLVGGPPTISWMGLAMKGLGPLAKGLRRLQRGSGKIGKAMRALSKKAHARVSALKLGDAARARLHRAVCTLTGHPVDVATGKVLTEHVDFELPGPLPLRWGRVWYSTSTYRGPLGHGWHHSYDAGLYVSEDLVLHRTTDGRYVPFPVLAPGEEHYDRAERLTLIRESGGYVLRDAERKTHVFREVGRDHGEHVLSMISDAAGARIEFRYDGRGRLVEIEDSAGRLLQLTHDDRDRMTSISAPRPDDPTRSFVLVRYVYDEAGDLTQVLDAHSQSFQYAYRKHLLIRETNRNGLCFHFEYDGEDETARCLRTWGDGGIYDHRLSYDEERSLTTVTNSLGYKTQYQHHDGLVVRVVDALGAITRTEYDEHDQKLRDIDAFGRDRRFRYDARGNLVEQQDYDGAILRFEYDAGDRLVRAVDANEGVWSWSYDDAGRVVGRTNPLGHSQQFTFQGVRLVAVVDSLGNTTQIAHDDMHNLRVVRAPDGSTSTRDHDALGRVVAQTDANGNVRRCRYDLLGRPVEIHEPDGNIRKLAYDGESNLVHAVDAHADVRMTYRGMGRLVERSQAGTTVRFEYDTEEQLIGLTNEHGQVYRFELGPTGEVLVEHGFDGIRRAYRRDRAGRVSAVERAGQLTSSYRYDAVGRVRVVEHSDGLRESYRYRADGALLEATNSTCTIAFERDAVGRILRESRDGHWVASEYDARGLRVRMQSSLGADQRIERNAMGDVLVLEHTAQHAPPTPFGVKFSRDPLGLELERSLPGGVRTRWQRDRLGRPVEQAITVRGRTLRARSYRWEPDDRLRAIVDALGGPIEFKHDALGNLAAVQYADGSRELRMPDAVGNLFRTESRSDRKYGPAGQLLESVDEQRVVTKYSYDPEGNLVRKQRSDGRIWSYLWSSDGTLREVERPDGARVTFSYDALGRRISKTFGKRTTCWIWDGNLPLHEWIEGDLEPVEEELIGNPYDPIDGTLKQREAHGDQTRPRGPPPATDRAITWLFEPETFAPLAKLVGNRRYAIVSDHLGTPYCMLDEQGAAVWSAQLGAWGELRRLEGDRAACPFRWPGQYEDVETGLYYNRCRYYDPDAGLYVSQDPIGLLGSRAIYAYVPDPQRSTDYFGLSGCDTPASSSLAGAKLNASLRVADAAGPVIDSLRNGGRLPPNYVTKAQAVAAGWEPGKALNNSVPGGQIGGDVFQNTTNVVPAAPGRTWYEADVGLSSSNKRSKQPGTRLLYSDDGLLYVTPDHYESAHPIGRWK